MRWLGCASGRDRREWFVVTCWGVGDRLAGGLGHSHACQLAHTPLCNTPTPLRSALLAGNEPLVGEKQPGSSSKCAVFGEVEGIKPGHLWLSRVRASQDGVHGPWVGGIHGPPSVGAYSVVLSGGYEVRDGLAAIASERWGSLSGDRGSDRDCHSFIHPLPRCPIPRDDLDRHSVVVSLMSLSSPSPPLSYSTPPGRPRPWRGLHLHRLRWPRPERQQAHGPAVTGPGAAGVQSGAGRQHVAQAAHPRGARVQVRRQIRAQGEDGGGWGDAC